MSMRGRVCLRLIRLGLIVTLLYLAAGIIIVMNYQELRWAWTQLPLYFKAQISGHGQEKVLLERAKQALIDKDPEAARNYLKQSLAIDPYSQEARYLYANSCYVLGARAESEGVLMGLIDMDALWYPATITLAQMYLAEGQSASARMLLEGQRTRLEDFMKRYQARTDEQVEARFNEKAVNVSRQYEHAIAQLDTVLRTLPGQPRDEGKESP